MNTPSNNIRSRVHTSSASTPTSSYKLARSRPPLALSADENIPKTLPQKRRSSMPSRTPAHSRAVRSKNVSESTPGRQTENLNREEDRSPTASLLLPPSPSVMMNPNMGESSEASTSMNRDAPLARDLRGYLCEDPNFDGDIEAIREIGSLYDCIVEDVLHVGDAARFICYLRSRNEFDNAAYEEFLSSERAFQVDHYDFDGIDTFSTPPTSVERYMHETQLNVVASQIMAGIAAAHKKRLMSTFTATLRKRSAPDRQHSYKFRVSNLQHVWTLNVEPPFVKLQLGVIVENFAEKKSNNDFQNMTALYRHILLKITNPPEKIQEYSIRINGSYAKEKNLKNLPDDIRNALLDFAEDLCGLGADELKPNTVVDFSTSRFFETLGDSFASRKKRLNELIDERIALRGDLFKALQRALRDIRSYEYEYYDNMQNFRWLPNNRHAKRDRRPPQEEHGAGEDYDGSHDTVFEDN